ncbi:MAG: hypothetical protein K2R98_10605 [Gemmataceae bacterium]|nr:hypothetical protein [Gemmataceae bacterium]
MWNCAKCKAEVDDGFEVCWQCGTTIDGQSDPSFSSAEAEGLGPATETTTEVSTAPRVAVATAIPAERADRMRRHLEAAGIAVFIGDETPTAVSEIVTLLVCETNAKRAAAILADISEKPPEREAVDASSVIPPPPAPFTQETAPPTPVSTVWQPPNKDALDPQSYIRALESRLSTLMDEKDVPGWKVNPAFDPEVNAFIQSYANNAMFLKKAQSMQQNRAKYFATMRTQATAPKKTEPDVQEQAQPLPPPTMPSQSFASDDTPPPRTPRPWGRWFARMLRRVVLLLLVLSCFTFLGAITYSQLGDQDLKKATERIQFDEKDSDWDWESLQAKRTAVPDGENAALELEQSIKSLPEQGADPADLWKALRDLDPVWPLNESEASRLRVELKNAELGLDHARELVKYNTGRYPTRSLDGSPPQLNGAPIPTQIQRIAHLLWLDSALRAHQRRRELALDSCQAILAAGRSVGDDPEMAMQMSRRSCQRLACSALERILAQGLVETEDPLKQTQKLFEDEAEQPILTYGVRGHRAWTDEVWKRVEVGTAGDLLPDTDEHKADILATQESTLGGFERWLKSGWVKENRALSLDLLTDAVVLANQAPEKRRQGLADLDSRIREKRKGGWPSGRYAPGCGPVTPLVNVMPSFQRTQAELRCAAAALAAERYYLANSHWPNRFEEMVPNFLSKVPTDPYDAQALRMRRIEGDGLIIYSVGPDRDDNQGALDRDGKDLKGKDIGFRLWDSEKRRSVPLPEKVPAPAAE